MGFQCITPGCTRDSGPSFCPHHAAIQDMQRGESNPKRDPSQETIRRIFNYANNGYQPTAIANILKMERGAVWDVLHPMHLWADRPRQ